MKKNPSAPHIIYLIPNDWYFWTHRLHLARAARDAGYQVTIATLPGAYVDQILAEGFQFHPLKLQRLNATPWTELRTILDIIALHRRIQPDLVHQVTLRVVLYGSIAAKITKVPLVNAITGLGFLFTSSGWKVKILRRILSLAYRICLSGKHIYTIFQNEDDRSIFIEQQIVKKEQTVLIAGAGVDTRRFAPSPDPPGEPVILLTARMLRDKGIPELVEASRLLRQRGVKAKVILAGMLDPGNPTAISEAEIKAWEQAGLIEWIGHQNDIPALLARAHIVCLPSYREGLPLSLIEAASCAKPIVTTDVPGCREIVHDGGNGLLVPAKDASALANALQRLIEDRGLRHQLGENGRKLVMEKFTQELVIQQTLQLYELLKEHQSPERLLPEPAQKQPSG